MNVVAALRGHALCALGVVLCMPDQASAITLETVVAPIYQFGNGASVNLGHTAIATTNFNRLVTGGSYVAACASPQMVPTTGQRFESAENYLGGLTLIITIPRRHPALVNMPGYNAATPGQVLHCTYNWISRATEGGYSLGGGGFTFQIGNGERSDGGTQLFTMSPPPLREEGEWTTCIP